MGISVTSNESAPSRKSRVFWFVVGCAGLSILCTLAIVAIGATMRIERTSGSITITDVYLTTGLDAQGQPLPATTQFPPGQPRIYCVVTISAPKPVNVGVRWFYGDELIFDSMALVDGRRAYFIEPPPGKVFSEGEYRVEVYLVKDPVRVIHFSVKP